VVKVQEGCEQRCTYCVIPLARGPSRSRPPEEVVDEVAGLVRAGFKEVVLTGIHLGAWGADLEGGRRGLADLVRKAAAVPGLVRLRLSSIEPMDITEELIELVAADPRVCRHLHVPLQSGSDEVLRRMNRNYTAAEYLAVVERVRAKVPLLGLTTDVMVGFPGETDRDFARTVDVVERARFSRLHVFRFSPRPGTPAAAMPGRVDQAVSRARSRKLIDLGRRLGREFRAGLVGRTMGVLIEKTGSGGTRGEGFTDNYVRVSVRGSALAANHLVPVRLERVTSGGMAGRTAL
jgi:threonylcarbamoyladenosine tRNA methylthiotransferase MtaB